MSAAEHLTALLDKVGRSAALRLLLDAESSLVRRRIGTKRTSYEVVSAAGYYRDGSMRCPFEDIKGEKACDYHEYSGCNFDEDGGAS